MILGCYCYLDTRTVVHVWLGGERCTCGGRGLRR